MSVFKRGGHWHYAFSIRGVRYRRSIPEARTKYEAEQAEVKARGDVYAGKYGRPTGQHDFVKFVEEVFRPWAEQNKRSWNTNDRYKLPVICEWFRGKTFAQISPLLIEKYKKHRRELPIEPKKKQRESAGADPKTRKPSTINRELNILSTIFSMAMRHKLVESNPVREVRKMPENNRRVRYLRDEEEPLLLSALAGGREHIRPLVIVAVGTGMRRGDQFNLRWEQVDFQRDVIHVPNSKTGNDYPVPMNEEVRAIMLGLKRQSKDSDYVFLNPETGAPYKDVKKAFGTACRKAGIKNLHWHDLRHTFGTRLAEAGHSEATIAELMGHTDPKTTRRYTHGTERAKREAVEAARTRGQERGNPLRVVKQIAG